MAEGRESGGEERGERTREVGVNCGEIDQRSGRAQGIGHNPWVEGVVVEGNDLQRR